MLHFPAAKCDGDLNLVVVFEKLSRLNDLRVNIVVIRFRPNADLFQLLLANLARFVSLLGRREAQLAIIEDSANRRSFVRSDFYQVQP